MDGYLSDFWQRHWWSPIISWGRCPLGILQLLMESLRITYLRGPPLLTQLPLPPMSTTMFEVCFFSYQKISTWGGCERSSWQGTSSDIPGTTAWHIWACKVCLGDPPTIPSLTSDCQILNSSQFSPSEMFVPYLENFHQSVFEIFLEHLSVRPLLWSRIS